MMALIRLVCFIAGASEGIKKVVGSLPEETPIKRFAIREDAQFSLIFVRGWVRVIKWYLKLSCPALYFSCWYNDIVLVV
jgi:hypothetical protein